MAFATRGYGEYDGLGTDNKDKLRSAVITAALQGVGIAALLLLPTAIIVDESEPDTIKVNNITPITVPPPPPPKPIEKVEDIVKPRPSLPAPTPTAPDPVFPIERDFGTIGEPILDGDFSIDPLPGGGTTIDDGAITVIPIPDPVLVAPQWDQRFARQFQPNFPSGKLRAGIEGVVKVRVLVGTNGRVKAVEQISATDPAFFKATERHALRKWRFKPATRDGQPIEDWKTISVNFTINDQ